MTAVALTVDEREALAAIAHDRRVAREKSEAEAAARQAEADRIASLRAELATLNEAEHAFYADEVTEDLKALATAMADYVAAFERLEGRCVRHASEVTERRLAIRRQLETVTLGMHIGEAHPLERLEPRIRTASQVDQSTHGLKRVFEGTLTQQHFRRY